MGFFDQMKQVGELKAKMEAVKQKLDETDIVTENEFVIIVVSGNRKIKSIEYKTERSSFFNFAHQHPE
jgi:DNA-binding protein YbaB